MTTSGERLATELSPELTAWLQDHGPQIAIDLKSAAANPADACRRLQDSMARAGASERLLDEVRHLAPAAHAPSNIVLSPDSADAEIRARVVTNAGILPYPGTDTHVVDHGGGVLATPRVFLIYMGNDWGVRQHGLNAAANQMTATLNALFRDDEYWPLLSEYGVGGPQLVGAAFHDYPTATTFYDGDPSKFGTGFIIPPGGSIPSLITHIVESNPAVTVHPATDEANLLYFLFLSSNHAVYQPTDPEHGQCGPGTSNNICGYHNAAHYHKDILGIPFGGPNLFYAVGCPGISTGGITHELVETFTDRDAETGWYSSDSEIGDICNRCTEGVVLTESGIAVASFWLVSQNRCVQQADRRHLRPSEQRGHPPGAGAGGFPHRPRGPAVTPQVVAPAAAPPSGPARTVAVGQSGLLAALAAAVRPEFRAEVIDVDPVEPVFGGPACAVSSCRRIARGNGMCVGHNGRWRSQGKPDLEGFIASTARRAPAGPRPAAGLPSAGVPVRGTPLRDVPGARRQVGPGRATRARRLDRRPARDRRVDDAADLSGVLLRSVDPPARRDPRRVV